MHLDIYSDTVCPWCLIGKRHLEKALTARPEADLTVRWRPFQLNPGMPAEGMDRQEYIEMKFGGPRQSPYERVAQAGLAAGVEFQFDKITRQPNTLDSHRLIDRAWDAGKQDAVVEAIFRAQFFDGRYIGDVDVLVACAEAAGMDGADVRAFLESDTDRERIAEEDAAARQMGINGVPFFVADNAIAVSGAQPPEVFHQLFDQARETKVAE